MFTWIKNLITNHPVKSVSILGLISAGNFILNLMKALSDGVIDDTEWHNLMSGANGVEALILGIAAIALKIGSK
jgi:hypothetical protein